MLLFYSNFDWIKKTIRKSNRLAKEEVNEADTILIQTF